MAVADDERPARAFLLKLLERFDNVLVVGAAGSGDEALELIEREAPDLLLLDVRMPGLDGFGVVHMLNGAPRPLIAFVTAFEEYADLATEVGAIGYLHKPICADDLATTLDRAQERLIHIDAAADMVARRG